MNSTSHDTSHKLTGQRSTRRRQSGHSLWLASVFMAFAALVGTACAPASPPAGGGGAEFIGPLTIPLPPIEIRPPATNIPFGICNVRYQPPGVNIVGATVTIPRVRFDPAKPIITVPDVKVKIPQLRVPLSTVTLKCLGLIDLPVQVDLIVPSTVVVRAATVNLAARTITLTNPSFTINGAGIGVRGLGDLVIPLPPIVKIPLPTTAIGF